MAGRVHRSAAKTLDGHRSEGYAPQRAGTPIPASTLSFQHVHAAATPRYRAGNLEHPIFLLVACFQHVHPRKHVNACVYAVSGCRALIRFTFPHGYRPVSLQQPFGGDVSPFCRRRRRRSSSDVGSEAELSAARDSEAATNGGLAWYLRLMDSKLSAAWDRLEVLLWNSAPIRPGRL